VGSFAAAQRRIDELQRWEPVEFCSSWLKQGRLGCERLRTRAAWAAGPPRLRDAYRTLGCSCCWGAS